jgi:hypothetical protein
MNADKRGSEVGEQRAAPGFRFSNYTRDDGDVSDHRNLLRFSSMEKKIFWMLFIVLGLIMDVALPLWWGLALTLPLGVFCWWVAYRSGWFE